MRVIVSFVFVLLIMTCFDSCFEAPHFPSTPEITFNNIIFRKGVKVDPFITPADSLIITLNFRDGDGDLGLGTDETKAPYHDKTYYLLEDGSGVYFEAGFDIATWLKDPQNQDVLINYKTKRTVAGYDTLPNFESPYFCSNWDVIKDSVDAIDTLYFKSNRNHYNIFIDFFVQQSDNSWKKFDWPSEFDYPNCQVNGFDGRFPILSKDVTQNAAQEGTIRYSMRSAAFLYIFSVKSLRLDVSIQDRALHRSNVVPTKVFTLQSILQ